LKEEEEHPVFLKKFLQKVTTFSNSELNEERTSKQAWNTFDNKFRSTGQILKVKHILQQWIHEA